MINKITLVCLLNSLSLLSFSQNNEGEIKQDSTRNTEEAPVFVTTLDDIDNGNSSQTSSGLLQSSRDVFSTTAAYNFGIARFRIRGYNSDQTVIMLNGIPMNDLESGRGTWYKWGGLNDVTRYAESKRWLTSNPYHFGGLGGYSNINAKASDIRKGHYLSYASTNRAYRHRLMYTQGTGMQSNGWAYAMSLSGRYSKEGYVEGTYYESFGYYFAAEKQYNKHHNFNLSVIGSPTNRGRNGISVQEAYDLTGNNYYNSYWGYQTINGKQVKRNSRQAMSHTPIITFNHEWKIDNNTKLNSSVYVNAGQYGQTSLNWNDAKDPRPDYYRYLPSYYYARNDSINGNILRDQWINDPTFSQIKWDELYAANRNNLYVMKDVDGIAGNDVKGLRAKYIVETRWNNILAYGMTSNLTKKLNDNINLSSGIYIQYQRNHYFKTINDLLGADYWVDIDRFATQVGVDPQIAMNDINKPNRIVRVGDKFEYDYFINNTKATTFGQLDFSYDKFDFYSTLELSTSNFFRNGINQNGKFPDNSKGKSEKSTFFNYALKGGVVYKISGRQFITADALVKTQAPWSRSAFVSPRTRNTVIEDLQNEFIYSGDISYILKYPKLKMRATYYYTERKNAVWSRSFYHDEYNSFVNYIMKGVDYLNHGLEFGLDAQVYGGFSVNAVVAYGQYLYTSRPTASIYVDNSAELLAENKTVYLKNYRVGGMPQSAYSIGVKYRGKKYWFAGANFNYYADIYLDPNPDRRTAEAVQNFVTTDPQWDKVLDQTQLSNGYSVSMFAGKSFKISNYYLNITVNISNLTNNQNYQSGGYEQLRYDVTNIDKFPPKLGYMYGFNYFAMAKLRF
ncbi:MAG TPA: Plug domain-containing protein [Crocinitomix sp.]|nr:Plug domain-containing protein [Crocinitomix sp.]